MEEFETEQGVLVEKAFYQNGESATQTARTSFEEERKHPTTLQFTDK